MCVCGGGGQGGGNLPVHGHYTFTWFMLSLFLFASVVGAPPRSSKSTELQAALQQEMDTLAAKTGFALQLVTPTPRVRLFVWSLLLPAGYTLHSCVRVPGRWWTAVI